MGELGGSKWPFASLPVKLHPPPTDISRKRLGIGQKYGATPRPTPHYTEYPGGFFAVFQKTVVADPDLA